VRNVSERTGTLAGWLARVGFDDPRRAVRLLEDGTLEPLIRRAAERDADLVRELGFTADPDLALLSLVRLVEGVEGSARLRLVERLGSRDTLRSALLAVVGASEALANWLVAHPDDVDLLDLDEDTLAADPRDVRAELLASVGADPNAPMPVAADRGAAGTDAMRRAYRRRLLRIAASDLTREDPLSVLPGVASALADLAAAALETALALARADQPDHGAGARLAVMGMGKTGGRELNYISDVDVIYVVEPAEGVAESDALAVGTRLATALARVCSSPSGEPALWEVDAALRPEGKQGPLVRTLASHVSYYKRWAKTWEFQALLKARCVAGDTELGAAYSAAISPMVWEAVTRENFVEDSQAMRRRVEAHVKPAEADRQLKLAAGGLRDVEFTVQLLQLVHGRLDPALRSPNTLGALRALAAAGYVGRSDAAQLSVCYRYLRVLEHRIQLYRLRRTHLLPTAEADLRRLARSVGMRAEGVDGLMTRLRQTRRDVRNLHEALFYRPLLPAAARLSTQDVALAPEAARARLKAMGYRDAEGALRHIAALTEGISRRAAIQRQLLPVMLGWFADGPDPDAGLLAFRKLSDELSSSHWYLKMLRDTGAAGRRLAQVLSTSRYVADALARAPEAVSWLGDGALLVARSPEEVSAEGDALLARRDEPGPAANALRGLRKRELIRAAIGDVLDACAGDRDAEIITPAADVALRGALRVAVVVCTRDAGLAQAPTRMLVVAMGRLGGREMMYASDADVLFVHDPVPGADPVVAQEFAVAVAGRLRAMLGELGPEPPLEVDAALRPEGRNGPITRALSSYAEYYERWAEIWERQALLRARPVAGDDDLARRFVALIDPFRYPEDGLSEPELREMRRIKARVEAERLPRGVPASRHLKLGRGGLADVEWTVQLLQLRHAGGHPELRTTGTLPALAAARDAGVLAESDEEQLRSAWLLASRIRSAVVLATGRTSGGRYNVLPHERGELRTVSRLLGYEPGQATEFEEDYLRAARRARAVTERIFYG
jgi:glutamate-ammonia-ligase adenylyltransferase